VIHRVAGVINTLVPSRAAAQASGILELFATGHYPHRSTTLTTTLLSFLSS